MADLNIYIVSFLFVATFVFAGLAIATSLHVFRLRNKRLSWRGGTLKGFPLFSTLFLLISIALVAVLWQYGDFWEIGAGAFYFVVAGSWFMSSYFSSKCYITDHGIVKNVNDPSQTVAWHQIGDYFKQTVPQGVRYTFIYYQDERKRPSQMIRLELVVPENRVEAFKKLILHKLGRRISCYGDESTIKVENI